MEGKDPPAHFTELGDMPQGQCWPPESSSVTCALVAREAPIIQTPARLPGSDLGGPTLRASLWENDNASLCFLGVGVLCTPLKVVSRGASQLGTPVGVHR